MKKQILVIHGGDAWNTYEEYMTQLKKWTYDPYEVRGAGWKNGLQEVLGDLYEVLLPTMPSKFNAKYQEWCIWMEKIMPYLHDHVIIIGHSLGANFVAKYLSDNTMPISVEQIHLVAGCYGCGGGFDLTGSLDNVHAQCAHIFIHHSTDDPIVPYHDALKYHSALSHAQLITYTDRGHFLQDDFPEMVALIKNA